MSDFSTEISQKNGLLSILMHSVVSCLCHHRVMGNTEFVVVPEDPSAWALPPLDRSQEAICCAAREGHVIFRGAPGAGKTTTLLSVVRDCVSRGESFIYLVPDRQRADRISADLRSIASDQARPVRTAVSYAYSVIEIWRTFRADPLGGLELLTGAQEDALVSEVLTSTDLPDLAHYLGQGTPSGLLRMEMRNLIATADRWGISPAALSSLAEKYDFPLWRSAARVLFELEADCNITHRGTLRLRHSQVEWMAAKLLNSWEEGAEYQQVTAQIPLPEVVVVDGLQDMTAATLKMLMVMAACGARIVAAADPDVAVATYRGALPQMDITLGHILNVPVRALAGVYRGNQQIRAAIGRVSQGITISGSASYRQVEVVRGVPDSKQETESIFLTAAHTDAQMGAHIARIVRESYLFHGRAWADHAVIVRSQGQADSIRRHLRRASVPVDYSTRAFEFMSEPTTRLLLEIIDHSWGNSPDQTAELLNDLVTSEFIAADAVDVHRALRIYREIFLERDEWEEEDSFDLEALLQWLTPDASSIVEETILNPLVAEDCAHFPVLENIQPLLEKLTKAARMLDIASHGKQLRPRHLLWNLWEASGVAEEWRSRAVGTGADAQWYDTQLDALVALFRVADVWEQRNPSGTAKDFARDLSDHQIPTDTLLARAFRPDAVAVLTPAEAAGGQWPVVVLAGAQHERWPNNVLRNQMLHADTLAEICLRNTIGADEPTWADVTDIRVQRRRVKDDEYRMFMAAIGTVIDELHVVVVSNDNSAPSELIDRTLGVRAGDRVENLERNEDGTVRYSVKPAPSPLDGVGVVGDLRFWATHSDEQEIDRIRTAQRALAMLIHEGIRGAHPREWGTPGELSSDQLIIGDEKPTISPSAVERIESCPLNWFASQIGAETPPGHSAAARGTFIHSLAEEYHQNPSLSVMQLFEQRWPKYSEGLDPLEKSREYDKVLTCVNGLISYLENVPASVEMLTEVEQFISQDMGNYIIRGMIDRLEPDGDGVKIVDFKTGRSKTAKEALEDPQMQTYQVALHYQGKTVTGAQLQYLREEEKTGRNASPAHVRGMRYQPALTPEERANRLAQLAKDIERMNATKFQAIVNPRCDFCSLHAICPVQNPNEGVSRG